ncbi:MAG TPA: hypothetical protein PLF22_07750 [Pseudomonadales bacterium]|nr:hypothetical protein [Pseudomonadales bacterium]
MIYQVLAAIVGIVAVLLVLLALKTLIRKGWLLGFIRGLCGSLLIAVAALMLLYVQDIRSYKVAESDRVIATLSFRQKELYLLEVDVQETNGGSRKATLQGEQWQLDARMLKWSPLLSAMGIRTGYRLELLQGRYQVMEMDRSTERSKEILSVSARFDLWDSISKRDLSAVQAVMGSTGFVPMADGAIFEVVVSGTNLIARPVNPAAKTAMANW